MATRYVVECRQLKSFSAYVEDTQGSFWGVLETRGKTRPCSYLEVDGLVVFDGLSIKIDA